MLEKLVGAAVVAFGLVNAVPSPAAVHPIGITADFIDDDLAGSGMELRDHGVKLGQRRHALRLRVLSDEDRATLLRLIDEIPATIGECVPGCSGDPAMAALFVQLVRALYEGDPLTLSAIAARSLLSPEAALAKLERLEASGLVRLSPSSTRDNAPLISPTPLLRAYGDDVLDRLYYAFSQALSRP
jgi:DNA-binding transcriptional ArsR family regulator